MDKTTQRIHKFHIAATPAGPLELTYNLESGWFAATLPDQVPIEYMDAFLVALGVVRNRFQAADGDGSAIRSVEGDVNAEWEASNQLMRRPK